MQSLRFLRSKASIPAWENKGINCPCKKHLGIKNWGIFVGFQNQCLVIFHFAQLGTTGWCKKALKAILTAHFPHSVKCTYGMKETSPHQANQISFSKWNVWNIWWARNIQEKIQIWNFKISLAYHFRVPWGHNKKPTKKASEKSFCRGSSLRIRNSEFHNFRMLQGMGSILCHARMYIWLCIKDFLIRLGQW